MGQCPAWALTCMEVTSTNPHLHGEDDHCEAHSGGDAHGHDDGLGVVEAGDHAHHVGQADGQD